MSELKSMVAELVERINASPEMLAVIRDWVDGYNGKTIGFKTPEGTFYVTFSERARINEGEPASFDLMLLSDQETIIDGLFNDPTKMRQYLKQGTVVIWGNLHELLKFAEIVVLTRS
ncbi:MAG: hypothetical protein ACTSSA_14555 [Candidatus Freyarchaeota archaeon]|nr:hypothetical protein [Candidatus Freyarchaeota archaeon]